MWLVDYSWICSFLRSVFMFYVWWFVPILTLEPTWLLKKELQNQLLKVGIVPSSNDLIDMLDKLGSLSSQVYQDLPKSIQDALLPLQGVCSQKRWQIMQILMFRFLLLYVSLSSFGLQHQIPLAKMSRWKKPFSHPFKPKLIVRTTNKSYHKRLHTNAIRSWMRCCCPSAIFYIN